MYELAASASNPAAQTTVTIWRAEQAGARYRATVTVVPAALLRPDASAGERVVANQRVTTVEGSLSSGADAALSLLAACHRGRPFAELAEMVC